MMFQQDFLTISIRLLLASDKFWYKESFVTLLFIKQLLHRQFSTNSAFNQTCHDASISRLISIMLKLSRLMKINFL